MLNGIFENKLTGNYFWMDCLNEGEIKEAKYFAYENEDAFAIKAKGLHCMTI